MLTTRGLPIIQIGHEKESYPVLSMHGFIDGSKTRSFLSVRWETRKGICCDVKYVSIYCTLCNFCVNIDVNYSSLGLYDIIYRTHTHDDIINNLIRVTVVENGKREEKLVGLNVGNVSMHVENPDDIKCGICNKNFTRTIYPGYHTGQFTVDSNMYLLNDHYRKRCDISRFDGIRTELASNRTEEMNAIYDAVKKYTDNNPPNPPQPPQVYAIGEGIPEFVKMTRKCYCGQNNILQCTLCGIEWKDTNPSTSHYRIAIKHHFGKTNVTCDFEDFIYTTQKKEKHSQASQQYCCVLCGEEYECADDDGDKSLPPKELVLDHFKSCLAANSHKFKAGGYNCVH